jgi:hypothetical protein
MWSLSREPVYALARRSSDGKLDGGYGVGFKRYIFLAIRIISDGDFDPKGLLS